MRKFPMIVALGASVALAACTAEVEEEGSLPDVDVSAEGGQLPEIDVDTADVDVGTRTETVEVPTVDVDMPNDDDDTVVE